MFAPGEDPCQAVPRFPSLQTGVHAGSPVRCPAVCKSHSPNADERGQLRPKLRPSAEGTPSIGVRASRLQPGLPFVTGPCPGRPRYGRSASDQSLAQLARWRSLRHSAAAISCDSDRSRISRAFEFCGWWFRPVRLGLVAPEPKLGSPLRTPLNLRE